MDINRIHEGGARLKTRPSMTKKASWVGENRTHDLSLRVNAPNRRATTTTFDNGMRVLGG
jgi:hypothetical protein